MPRLIEERTTVDMFYLSRTGTTEGPFTESVIVDMIRSRLAESGHICPVGGQTWILLGDHPPFAKAFEERRVRESAPPPSVAPQSAAAAPVAPALPKPAPVPVVADAPTVVAPVSQRAPLTPMAPPVGQSSFQPPVPQFQQQQQQFQPQPSWGPAPASFGPRPSGFNGTFSLPPPKKSSNVGAIIGAVFGVLFVLAGGGAAVAYFFFFKSAPLAENFAEGTQVYAEVGSIKRSALGMASLTIVDSSKVDQKKALEDAQNGIANAFELSKDDAARVALGIRGIAVGGHDVGDKSKGTMAVVIAWDDTKSAETLLKSIRFLPEGDVGKAGKRYSLKKRDLTPEQKKGLGLLESSLSSLQLASNGSDRLVWFPKKKIMTLGDERSTEEIVSVIEGGQKSLLDSKAFAAKKSELDGAGLHGFIDPVAFKSDATKDFYKFVDGTSPITIAIVPERPGFRMTMKGEIASVQHDMAKIEGWLDSPGLALPKKLPEETFAYLGFSSKQKMSGKEARDAFFKSLSKEQATAGLQKNVEEGEKALGVELATVFDALGDEGAIAAVAKNGYRYQKGATPSFDDFAVIYAQKIRDAAAAKKLVGTLKEKIAGGPFKITPKGDDLVVEAEKPFPRVEIRFVDGSLVAVAGSKDLAERTYAAFGGTKALGSDAAHNAAIADLNAKHLLLWIDMGRVVDTAMTATPSLKEAATAMGVDTQSLVVSGDKRATAALGITFAKSGDKLGYTIDSMNLPIVAGAGAALAPALLMGGLDDLKHDKADKHDAKSDVLAKGSLDVKKTSSISAASSSDFPALCEQAMSRYERCVYAKIPASARGNVIKSLRDGVTRQKSDFRVRYCQALLDAADRSNPGCN